MGNGWMVDLFWEGGEQVGRWMDGRVSRWMDGWPDGREQVWVDGWMGEYMKEGRRGGWMGEEVNGWMGGQNER